MPSKDKLSYAIGSYFANQVKHDHLDVDLDTIASAMKDILTDKPTKMSEAEVKETITQLQHALPAYVAGLNKAKGEEYLAKNGKAPGVTTLPSGLQYKVLKEGTGEKPKPTDTVVVAYKGTMTDGSVFDQNDKFTTPVTGHTIKGWSDILPMMKTGSKWEVTIPSDLAYGARGPQKIGPNAVLIFDMEWLSIAPPSATPAPTAPKPGPTPISTRPPGAAVNSAPPAPGAPATTTTPVVSGQIIKVPSKAELDKGAKIEVITNVPNSQ
jgi:FKBP-type peptidyl-prolyl cis-trans isomerase FklB